MSSFHLVFRLLSKTSHVILDEIHERDVLSDFLMIILRDLMARRDDLKLILMSATLNAEMFSQYFSSFTFLYYFILAFLLLRWYIYCFMLVLMQIQYRAIEARGEIPFHFSFISPTFFTQIPQMGTFVKWFSLIFLFFP